LSVEPQHTMRLVLGPGEGESVQIGGLGARFMVGAGESGGGFSLVEHPIAPRALAAPMHVHEREDEYSFILEGRVGVQVGEEIRVAEPGDLVFKPRGIWHAFWNAGDEPARLLEIISPAGFEQYFADLAPWFPPQVPEPDFAEIAAVQARYGLTVDFGSVERLVAEHGLAM
jgi:mannose-6-phosphate isomerase-like protein (cupin superfamily)